jgi:hypothetical protein
MSEITQKDGIIRRVMSALETAPRGSQELDCMISYALELARGEFDQVMMELLVNEGFSWNVISEIWEGKVAPYTQSLDSGIEGENIAFVMRSEKRAQWAAVHKAEDGEEYVAWARTEVLARRLAGLNGLLAETAKRSSEIAAGKADDETPTEAPSAKTVEEPVVEEAPAEEAGVNRDEEEAPEKPEHLRMVPAAGAGREAESWNVLF